MYKNQFFLSLSVPRFKAVSVNRGQHHRLLLLLHVKKQAYSLTHVQSSLHHS